MVAIENNQNFKIEEKNSLLKAWMNQTEFLSVEKRNFFEDLEQRILINAQNLFYFLKREEYLEILPLYTSLLSVYKLTLMMNNAVTIEYANKIIEDMKIGGDEFAIIFKNANNKQSKQVCKKIKADLAAEEFIFNEKTTFNVSISIGISEYLISDSLSIDDFIKGVDQKLYEAKHSGKNQIVL